MYAKISANFAAHVLIGHGRGVTVLVGVSVLLTDLQTACLLVDR